MVPRIDIGAHGEQEVDEAEMASAGRPMENGHAKLRWGGAAGVAVVDW
jgi:hypothetical protein